MPRVLRISLLLNVVRKPNSSRIAFSLKVLFPSATGKIAKISDAADILGVYIIYQIVGHSALSQWSRKELAALPCSPNQFPRFPRATPIVVEVWLLTWDRGIH